MDTRIRACTLGDQQEFSKLFSVVEEFHRQQLPSRFRGPPEDYATSLLKNTLHDKMSKILVAEADGKILGYVRVMIKDLPDHPIINPGQLVSVEELSVDPSHRRLGIGAALMQEAEKFARERGFSEIELNVWGVNLGADEFYRSLGYKPIRTFFAKHL